VIRILEFGNVGKADVIVLPWDRTVIALPWTSMIAFLGLLMGSGKRPVAFRKSAYSR